MATEEVPEPKVDIERIQRLLKLLGDYHNGNGKEECKTEQAIKKLQKRQGLKEDGTPSNELIPLLLDELLPYQLVLSEQGCLKDGVNVSEEDTENALRKFQNKYGIREREGILGEKTRSMLDELSLVAFETVLRAELGAIPGIMERGSGGAPLSRAHEARLAGLAFSGGGIRSATFNLGVLQALAKHRMLGCFDYLSTVSGGGYIGGWLSALLRHRGKQLEAVEDELSKPDNHSEDECAKPGKDHGESQHIRFLRSYSNYLTPRLGVLGLDTLAAVSTYLRNLLLNQTLLAAILGVILLLPRLVNRVGQGMVPWAGGLLQNVEPRFGMAVLAAWLCLVVAIVFAIWNLTCDRKKPCSLQGSWGVLVTVVLPLVLASWAGGYYLVYAALNGLQCWHWVWKAIVLLVAALAVGSIGARRLRREVDQSSEAHKSGRWRWLFASVGAGALGGALLKLLADFIAHVFGIYTGSDGGVLALIGSGDSLQWTWLVPTLAGPLVLTVFTLTAVLFIGLMERGFSGFQREWWARLGGQLLRVQVIWTLLFGVVFLAAPLLAWAVTMAPAWLGSVGVGWIVTTLGSLFAAKSPATGAGGTNGRRWLELLARIGPYVFLAGVFLLLSAGLDNLLASLSTACPRGVDPYYYTFPQLVAVYSCSSGNTDLLPLLALFGACVLVAGLLGWRVNVNVFSLHNFYHHRLARCYLGAARKESERRSDSYTGFDPDDDLPLSRLVQRPYPIINAALNLAAGEELAWQTRKAASFIFSPLYSGYYQINLEEQKGNYRLTAKYGSETVPKGVRLGSAMAVSGAAASPNMGYHTVPAIAFLLTVFNVRLGRWCANPSNAKWQKSDPCFAPWYLFKELTGSADKDNNFVYLSDGGHFENLGIYELVRRRCRYIVASDAAADDDYRFDDLGNAIRKCYTDFGIRIELQPDQLRPAGDSGRSAVHGVVGLIHYEDVDKGAQPGMLLYIKPSLSGDEPADILQYAARNKGFPQQPTADQWFDESQFESYRNLGYHIADAVLKPALETVDAERTGAGNKGKTEKCHGDLEGIFVNLRQAWYPRSAGAAAFTKHAETLDKIYERLRTDPTLAFLDRNFYPEWDEVVSQIRDHETGEKHPGQWLATGIRESSLTADVLSVFEAELQLEQAGGPGALSGRERPWLPTDEKTFRNGFYLCNAMMQLMEDVYLDLDLEHEYAHPDNRGWINLFKHWSWCPMFQATWAVCAGTYGARFQSFCKLRLDLDMGAVRVGDAKSVADARKDLNALECGLIDEFFRGNQELEEEGTVIVLRLQLQDKEKQGKELQGKPVAAPLGFTVGFAVLNRAEEIVYFRIRDHLRKMGLARRALAEMRHKKGLIKGCRIGNMPSGSAEPFSTDDKLRFERLFESVRYEAAATPGRSTEEGGH